MRPFKPVALALATAATVVALVLVRRESPPSADLDTRIDAFWTWWRSSAPRLAAALDSGKAVSIAEELGARVSSIDPRLAWETGPGLHGARHHLALSPEGDIALRVLTQRCIDRAPPADASWEYYPARQAFPRSGDWALEFQEVGGVTLDFPRARVGVEVDAARELLHVTFHHPALASVSQDQRTAAAFLTLDSVLGEDAVERWIGRIATSTAPIPGGKTLREVADAVKALEKSATGEQFAIFKANTSGGEPMFATVNLALKRLDHLRLDQSLTIEIELKDPTPRGLTTDGEAAILDALEDELVAALGGDAVYLGRETGGGLRVVHLHVDRSGNAQQRTRAWASRHPERQISISVGDDPAWEFLRRW